MFHRLTPTPISSVAVWIKFDLINILYSNMSSSIDAMSGDIWKEGIADKGAFSSKLHYTNFQLQWLSRDPIRFDCLERNEIVPW